MNKKNGFKKTISVILIFLMVLCIFPINAFAAEKDVKAILNDTMKELAETVTEPSFGTFSGEWSVLCLARGGYYEKDSKYFADYYDRIVKTVNETAASVNLNGALHKVKLTENSRLILALSSIGKDARKVGDWNLVKPYEDFKHIKKQGINGPIFALIALDTNNYQTEDKTIRQQCIDYILEMHLEDGGWSLGGNVSDPDITAMTLQALVNYKDQAAVKKACDEAIAWLSEAQHTDGGFASWGTSNSESIAQVITALSVWGIDAGKDARFVKGGNSAIDAILGFYDEEENGFKHIMTGNVDAMATDQACYALVAYQRFLDGKTSLYDMSDVEFEVLEAEVTLGDVNGDEKINATDVGLVLAYYYEEGDLNESQLKAADVNKDNKIDTVDATKILAYYYEESDAL